MTAQSQAIARQHIQYLHERGLRAHQIAAQAREAMKMAKCHNHRRRLSADWEVEMAFASAWERTMWILVGKEV